MGNQQRKFGVNQALTVANGINPVLLVDFTLPGVSGGMDDIQVIVNGAYAAGGNGSFKANAAPGTYMEIYVLILTPTDAVLRRITQSSGEYRLRTIDVHDCVVIDEIDTATRVQVYAVLEQAPTATIDLDWTLLFNVNEGIKR